MLKNLKALLFGVILALIICEIVLRIYNPFSNFIKHGKLILPANQNVVFENKWIPQLDKQIHYSRNSLGFRGPEPIDSLPKLNSIICVGGSTTACYFLSDSTTWPFLLGEKLSDSLPGVWVNNAGIDGHSTFGHLLLLREYIVKLKPRYILFLIGINDVETEKPELFDEMNDNSIHFTSVKQFFKSLMNKTEIGSTIFQWYSVRLAYKKGLIHKEINFRSLPDTNLSDSYMRRIIEQQKPYLKGYHDRIEEMIKLCTKNNIKAIFLTQPSLFGNYFDSTTKTNMGTKYFPDDSIRNNILQEKILERYNDIVRSFAGEARIIDLSALMPKNSCYYYDFIHYNKKGAQKVADILSYELEKIIH